MPPHHSNPPANPHGAPQQRTGLPDLLHNSANIISAPSQVPQPQQQYQQPHIAPVRQEQVNHVPSIYLAPRPTETTLPQINKPNESTTTQVPQLKKEEPKPEATVSAPVPETIKVQDQVTIQESAPAAASAPVGDIKTDTVSTTTPATSTTADAVPVSVSQVGEAPNVVQEKKVPDTEQIVSRVEKPVESQPEVTPAAVPVPVPAPALATAPTEPAPTDKDVEMAPSKSATPVPQSIVEQNTRVSEATKAPESNGKHDLEDKNDEEKILKRPTVETTTESVPVNQPVEKENEKVEVPPPPEQPSSEKREKEVNGSIKKPLENESKVDIPQFSSNITAQNEEAKSGEETKKDATKTSPAKQGEVKEVIPSSTETVSKPDVEKDNKEKDKDEDEVMADEDDVKKDENPEPPMRKIEEDENYDDE